MIDWWLFINIPENEHENALIWYEAELERFQQAKLEAQSHLEQRADESLSGISSVNASKTSSTSSHSQEIEIRVKVTSAEIKAKKLAMEKQRQKQELEL